MINRLYKKLLGNIETTSESKIVLLRSIAIFVLFSITAYTVYLAPIGIDKLFIAILFVMFWYSRANYFWFAFFIIVSSFPGGIFTERAADELRRLPIYSFMPKMSFSVLDIFLILALLKAFVKEKSTKHKDVLKLRNIVYIFPYILIISFFYGMSLKMFLNSTIRGLFFYTLIYSFPALINSKKDVFKFMLMFFPFIIFELITQIYAINTGYKFICILRPELLTQVFNSITGEVRAIPDGYLIVRMGFIFAFIIMDNYEKVVPKIYPLLIILISITSVLFSATRSAIVMFLFIFILYFILIAKKKPNIILQVFISVIIILVILDFVKVVDFNDILYSSYRRFVGAVAIESGSLKTEDTFDYRINTRLPIILESIKHSLLVGYGLSDQYYKVYDGHLGGIPIGLLQAGVLGFSAYVFFIYRIFKRFFHYIKKIPSDNSYASSLKIFVLAFFGYLSVNFTVEPIYVLNVSTLPQEVLIVFLVASSVIYLSIREQAYKNLELKKVNNNSG